MSTPDHVTHYTMARGQIEVSFPNEDAICRWCPYCYSEYGLDRARCRITDEVLRFPYSERGIKCPLILEEEECLS